MAVVIDVSRFDAEVQQVLKNFQELNDSIQDNKLRRRVMRKPAKIVVDAARANIPISQRSKRENYRYNTPKVVQRKRAPKGRGRKVATYYPGNLRKSIKRLRFRKSPREFIGPKLVKKGKSGGEYGLSGTRVDGYYAPMVLGSADAFRRTFMEPAIKKSAARAFSVAQQELEKELNKLKRKTGL